MNLGLNGKRALVTGSSASIGAAIADSLGEQFVKTQDTVNCDIMVDPSMTWPRARSPTGFCEWFGWKRSTIIDLG